MPFFPFTTKREALSSSRLLQRPWNKVLDQQTDRAQTSIQEVWRRRWWLEQNKKANQNATRGVGSPRLFQQARGKSFNWKPALSNFAKRWFPPPFAVQRSTPTLKSKAAAVVDPPKQAKQILRTVSFGRYGTPSFQPKQRFGRGKTACAEASTAQIEQISGMFEGLLKRA